jgi:hypothetical protein
MRYFHFCFSGHLILAIWSLKSAIDSLLSNDFLFSFICLSFVVWQVIEANRKYRDDQLWQYFHDANKSADQVAALVREINIPPTIEEVLGVINKTLTIDELRHILLERKVESEITVKTDCMYFSNSIHLKCAVNPATPCSRCSHHRLPTGNAQDL